MEKLNFTGLLQHCGFNLASKTRWIYFKCKTPCLKGKGNSEVYPTTGHEGRQRDDKYICALSLTSVVEKVGVQGYAPAAFTPGEETRLLILREAGWASDPV